MISLAPQRKACKNQTYNLTKKHIFTTVLLQIGSLHFWRNQESEVTVWAEEAAHMKPHFIQALVQKH